MSTHNDTSKLNVNIDSTSRWNVNGASDLNNLGLKNGATLSLASNTFAVADTLTLELAGTNLSGHIIGTAGSDFTLGSEVLLDFGTGFYVEGAHSYDLFSATTHVIGDFLALIDWGNLDPNAIIDNISFDGSTLSFEMTQVPEPGTWALILGGLGVLGYLQRVRRNRK